MVATIEPGEDIRLLGGALYLTQLRNVGAAFSFAEGWTIVFSLVAVVVAVVIVRTARRLYSTGWAVTLGLVLGGALGNLIDRIFRDPGFLRGGVVDFLSVFGPDGSVWPVFNVADSAIVCGGILGALLALRGIEFDGSRATRRRRTPPDGPPDLADRVPQWPPRPRERHNGSRDELRRPAPRPAGARRARGAAGRPGALPAVRALPHGRGRGRRRAAASWSTDGCAARATGSPRAAGSRSSCRRRRGSRSRRARSRG